MIDLFFLTSALLGLYLILIINYLNSGFIKGLISKIKDHSKWAIFEFPRKNTITCLTSDWKNLIGSIVLITTIFFTINFLYLVLFPLLQIVYLTLFSSDFLAWVPIANNFFSADYLFRLSTAVNIMAICWIVFGGYFKYFSFYQSVNSAFQHPQSDNLSEFEDHTAIIFPHYSHLVDDLTIVDSVALLIDGFRKSNKKYRIYHIYQPKNFEAVYYNDYVTELWILGHGDHGGLSYGHKGDEYIEYKKLRTVYPRKKTIIQLHCNCGTGKSLKEINRCEGYVSNYVRFSFQNRCYIINHFKQMKTKSE